MSTVVIPVRIYPKMTGYLFLLVLFAETHGEADNESRKGYGKSSVVYTRWGKTKCNSSADLVHSGYVGGSNYHDPGAAVEPLCLPTNPEWEEFKDGLDGQKAKVFGAEYQMHTVSGSWREYHDQDVPCAVCLVHRRSVVKMFPGRKTCYEGWEFEYNGYLTAGRPIHAAGSTYTCVDMKPDIVDEGKANKNGYLFYQVEAHCGSLKCPPYVQGRELVCVVCSK